jgi:hypothetical protein
MNNEIIVKNNLKSLSYEINNIDSMLRTKLLLIDDEIQDLKRILSEVTSNYMIILKNIL